MRCFHCRIGHVLFARLQAGRPLHGGWHLGLGGQLPGAVHQVQLLQHHLRHGERARAHRHLDVHVGAQEHLLQRGPQGERGHAAGAGQSETLSVRHVKIQDICSQEWTITSFPSYPHTKCIKTKWTMDVNNGQFVLLRSWFRWLAATRIKRRSRGSWKSEIPGNIPSSSTTPSPGGSAPRGGRLSEALWWPRAEQLMSVSSLFSRFISKKVLYHLSVDKPVVYDGTDLQWTPRWGGGRPMPQPPSAELRDQSTLRKHVTDSRFSPGWREIWYSVNVSDRSLTAGGLLCLLMETLGFCLFIYTDHHFSEEKLTWILWNTHSCQFYCWLINIVLAA